MTKKLAIVGAGSSGLQSACHFVYWLGREWEITLIHNPSIPTLGIGESTNGGFPVILMKGLNFELEDMEKLSATNKFGTLYEDWRKEPFMAGLIVGSHALHFDTNKFKEFAIPRLHEVWRNKFNEIQGNVDSITDEGDRVKLIIDGETHTFDYVINNMGFPKDFSNYETFESHMVNHCLVHNIPGDYSTTGYTGHTATMDGWMFEVPLTTRMSYGYLFNDKITDVEIAKKNFSKKINVAINKLQGIEYEFISYCNKTPLVNRVLSNGNQAFFFEPMFANSLLSYDVFNRCFFDFISGKKDESRVNVECSFQMSVVRDTIQFKYHGGSVYETPFWKYAKEQTKDFMSESDLFRILLEIAEINTVAGTEKMSTAGLLYSWDRWSKLDKSLGYNFLNKSSAPSS